MESMQYENRGKDHIFGKNFHSKGENHSVPLKRKMDSPSDVRNPCPLQLCRENSDNGIPCPPKEMRGRGGSVLDLECMFSEKMHKRGLRKL